MIDKKLSELKNDIPNFNINEYKNGIYEKYENKPKKVFSLKPLYAGLTLCFGLILLLVILATNKPISQEIGGFYEKDPNISLEQSLLKIIDEIKFVYSKENVEALELSNLGIISSNQYEEIKKLEQDNSLNRGYELIENISENYTYRCYLGEKNQKDVTILVDNNSTDKVVVYYSLDYQLSCNTSDILNSYYKHNEEKKDIIKFSSEMEAEKVRLSFGDEKSDNIVNYVMKENEVETIYALANNKTVEKLNAYCGEYNQDSFCYIPELKFEGNEDPDKLYCCGYNLITSLKTRIEGISTGKKTIYEVKKNTINSPLLAGYISQETYELVEKVRKNTPLVYGGKYPTSLAVYASLIEKGYIDEKIKWYEMEYDTLIPHVLEGMYYLDVFQYQEITVIKDIINNDNINYTFEILINPSSHYDSINKAEKVSHEQKETRTSLIYGEKMALADFTSEKTEEIIKKVTGNKEIEEVIQVEGRKQIKFFGTSELLHLNFYATYDKVYEGYLEEINKLVVKKEDIYSEQDDILVQLYLGSDYYFDYDEYVDFICSKKYIKNTYIVTFFGFKGTILKQEEVTKGSSANPPSPEKIDGYTFIGWDQDFNNVTNDLEVRPIYESNKCIVTFIGLKGEILQVEEIEKGGTPTAPIAPKLPGYRFIGWDHDLENITEDLVIKAIYEEKELETFTVTFIGFKGEELKTEKVLEGNAATAPTERLNWYGYTFMGWDQEFDCITEDLIVTAIFRFEYYVRFETNGGILVSGNESQIVNYVEEIVYPVYEKEGYILKDYDVQYKEDERRITVNVIWERNPELYRLELYLDGEQYLEKYYQENEKIDIELPKSEYGGLIFDKDIPSIMPSEDITIYMTWDIEKIKLTIAFTEDNIDEFEYYKGSVIEEPNTDHFTSFTNPGHEFKGWDTEFPFILLEDTTITAIWTPYKQHLIFNGNGANVLQYGELDIEYGDYLTLPYVEKEGFELEGWYCYTVRITNGEWKSLYSNYEELVIEAKWKFADEYYEYGRYPQSHVSDKNLIEELNKLTVTNSKGYYEYNGEEYCKVEAAPVVENELYYSDGSVIVKGTEWFKVEPIKWKVAGTNPYTLTPMYLLDVMYFDLDNDPYTKSDLRYYLNNVFLNKAFSKDEIDGLIPFSRVIVESFVDGNKVTTIGTGVKDKILAKSVNTDDERIELTDYALAKGAIVCKTTNNTTNVSKYYGSWWVFEQYQISYNYFKQIYYDSYKEKFVHSIPNIRGICVNFSIIINI